MSGDAHAGRVIALRRALRDYCLVVVAAAVVAFVVALACRVAGVNPYSFTQLVWLRTAFTSFVLLYLAAVMAGVGSRWEVIAIATIPFVAQFYQVGLGWDFAPGAGLMRTLPYLVMALAMVLAVARRRWRPSIRETVAIGAVLGVAITAGMKAWHLTTAALAAVFFAGLLLPLFYAYVAGVARVGHRRLDQLLLGLTIGIFLLLFGFFATVQLGLRVQTVFGYGTMAAAMNIGDFNAVGTYLLLLWPFALAFTVRRSRILTALLFVMVAAAVFAGLSRTMLFIMPVLLAVSLPACLPRVNVRNALRFGMVLIGAAALALSSLNWLNLTPLTLTRWQQRLDLDVVSYFRPVDVLASVSPGSQSQETRAVIRRQGWQMFEASPLIGQGWGTFPYFSRVEQTSAHSLTVDVLAEAGVLGGSLLWGSILICVWRLGHGFLRRRGDVRLQLVFAMSFLLWLMAAHTLGAQLFVASDQGFTTGAINGTLLVLYLNHGVIRYATVRHGLPA